MSTEYVWEHPGGDLQEVGAPCHTKAMCPYCSEGGACVAKDDCANEECENATYGLMLCECPHLIYIAASIQHYEPCWQRVPMPDDDSTWEHPGIPSLFACQTNERDILNDLLFDMVMGRHPERRIHTEHQVKELSTLALSKGACSEGKGYYVALEAEGGAIFATNAPAFIEEIASLVRNTTKEPPAKKTRKRKGE